MRRDAGLRSGEPDDRIGSVVEGRLLQAIRVLFRFSRRCHLFVTALVVALIGAASGIGGAVIAFRAQLRVARLTASLNEQRAESDARRSYEYEARKRLYSVCTSRCACACWTALTAPCGRLPRSSRRRVLGDLGTARLSTG